MILLFETALLTSVAITKLPVPVFPLNSATAFVLVSSNLISGTESLMCNSLELGVKVY